MKVHACLILRVTGIQASVDKNVPRERTGSFFGCVEGAEVCLFTGKGVPAIYGMQ